MAVRVDPLPLEFWSLRGCVYVYVNVDMYEDGKEDTQLDLFAQGIGGDHGLDTHTQ